MAALWFVLGVAIAALIAVVPFVLALLDAAATISSL